MGRKKYFCDYCEVIQNQPQIIKKHNEGLPHQKCRTSYYAHDRSLEEILRIERLKTPCKRAMSNSCAFGTFCRFSHYTEKELLMMEYQVAEQKHGLKAYEKSVDDYLNVLQRKKVSSGLTNKIYSNVLPQSLQPWDFNQMKKSPTNEWG